MSITPLNRIRIALVDTATPSLLSVATNGLVDYADLYAEHGGGAGGVAAMRATVMEAAGVLARYYAAQPTSVSGGGEGVSWSADRHAFYDALSRGQGLGPGFEDTAATGDGVSGYSLVVVRW